VSIDGCPINPGLAENSVFLDFTKLKSLPDGWSTENQGKTEFTDKGLTFQVAKSLDSQNLISNFYIFFGSIEFKLRTASGGGVVSTAVLLSDDLDEIDFEAVNKSPDKIESAYFGKGKKDGKGTTGGVHDIPGRNDRVVTYKIDWTPDRVAWSIDGNVVRVLTPSSAQYGPDGFPQTPMKVKFGAWAPGDPTVNEEGIVQWSGGPIDWSKGPYTMTLESLNVVNYSPGKSYTYSDRSGSKESIKVEGGSLLGNAGGAPSVESPTTSSVGPAPPSATTGPSGTDNGKGDNQSSASAPSSTPKGGVSKPSNATTSAASGTTSSTRTNSPQLSSTNDASRMIPGASILVVIGAYVLQTLL
jgi:beta-glucanase (GH16 family)